MSYLENFYVWASLEPMTWFALFVLGTLGDALLTIYALKRGAMEVNPLMKWLMGKTSPVVALAALKVPAVVGIFGAMQSIVAWLPVLALLYIGLCGWNVWQIYKMR